jgi:hypothetical protein
VVEVVSPAAPAFYRHDGAGQILDADQTLEGEAVVPGFSCPLAEIL